MSFNSEIAALKDARALIAGGWTQGAHFMDANGAPCHAEDAASYCLTGALAVSRERCAPSIEHWDLSHLVYAQLVAPNAFHSPPVEDTLVSWNDWHGRRKDEVLALLDRTIEAVERKHAYERERTEAP